MIFRDSFCRVFHCAEDHFASSLFWRGLNPLARLPAALLFPVLRKVFADEFRLINDLGVAEDRQTFLAEIMHYLAIRRSRRSLFKRFLGFRLSGRRLLAMADRIFVRA